MTDSGSINPFSKNNDLGGHEYTDAEMQTIAAIAMTLRERDWTLKTPWDAPSGKMPRPRDYIPMFTKSAGFIFELAKNLAAFPVGPNIENKSIEDWLAIILKIQFGESPPSQHAYGPRPPYGNKTGFSMDAVEALLKREEQAEVMIEGMSLKAAEEYLGEGFDVKQMDNGSFVAHPKQALDHIEVTITVEPEVDPDEDVEIPVPDWIVNCDPLRAREVLVQLCMHEPGLFMPDQSISGSELIGTVAELLEKLKHEPQELDDCMTRTAVPSATVSRWMLPSKDTEHE